MSLQVLKSAGVILAHSQHKRESTCKKNKKNNPHTKNKKNKKKSVKEPCEKKNQPRHQSKKRGAKQCNGIAKEEDSKRRYTQNSDIAEEDATV